MLKKPTILILLAMNIFCKNAFSDFDSIKIVIEKQPFKEIYYGLGTNKIDLPKKRFYTPPMSFYPLNDTIFIYDAFVKNLYMVNDASIIKHPLDFPVIDFTYYKNNVYIFDSKNILVLDNNINKIVKTISVDLPSNINSIRKTSFFFENFLFIGDFSVKKMSNQFVFIYDLEKKESSMKIDTNDLFVPLNNCKRSEIGKLQRLLFSNSDTKFLGQTSELVFYCIFKEQGQSVDYYVYFKQSGKIKAVNTHFEAYSIDLLTLKPLMFLNDSTGIFQALKWKDGSPDKLIYNKFKIVKLFK
jgi:hypothetical protein